MRMIGKAAFFKRDLSAIAHSSTVDEMSQRLDEVEASIKAGTENSGSCIRHKLAI